MNRDETLRQVAALYAAGLTVVPVRTDGSKRPALDSWKNYQDQRPTPEQTMTWFSGDRLPGVGILTGNGVEMAEIEGHAAPLLSQIRGYAEAVGMLDLYRKATTGWLERSPSGGFHWFYRVDGEVPGNTKLARKPASPEELAVNPQDKIKVLTETRGTGGFVVVAPSGGTVHETGRPWELLLGGPDTMATLSLDELADWHRMLSIVDAMPAAAPARTGPDNGVFSGTGTGGTSSGTFDAITPGDDFEAKTSWADLLIPAGWTLVYTDADGTSYWRRPGKTHGQASATTGRAQDRDRLYVFSTSTEFPDLEPITKFHAFAILHHNGDDSKAATWLRSKGYGQAPGVPTTPPRKDTPWENTQTTPQLAQTATAADTNAAPTANPAPPAGGPAGTTPAPTATGPGYTTADAPPTNPAHTAAAPAGFPPSSATAQNQSSPPANVATGLDTPARNGTGTDEANGTWTPAPPAAPPAANQTQGNLATVHQLDPTRERPQLTVMHRSLVHSDDGNALALIDQYQDRLRYSPDRAKWLCWNGRIWEWQPRGGGDAREFAKDVARSLPENTSEATKHKRYTLQAIGISNMLAQAQTDSRITVRTEDLDAHPWELNTPGGILNLRTGKLMPSDPTKLHTRMTACTPDPEADTRMLQKFLADTFPGNPLLAGYVQRLLGYSCVGEVLSHILPFGFGGGGNGKGVLFEMVAGVLGDYATSTPEGFLMAQNYKNHSTEIAKLSGARFVTCAEVGEEDKFDEAKVKLLTGGDRLTARFMRQDEFTFKPTHHLWLSGNHQPKVESGGASFWRRLRLIPFLHSVPEENIIEGLADMLAHEHGPAVLHWIAQGAAEYATNGLQEPDIVTQSTKDYALSVDTVGRFLDEECLVGEAAAGQAVHVSRLTAAYTAWCGHNGEKALDGRVLANHLAKHGVLTGRDAPRSSSGRMYGNLVLIDRSVGPAAWEDPTTPAREKIF